MSIAALTGFALSVVLELPDGIKFIAFLVTIFTIVVFLSEVIGRRNERMKLSEVVERGRRTLITIRNVITIKARRIRSKVAGGIDAILFITAISSISLLTFLLISSFSAYSALVIVFLIVMYAVGLFIIHLGTRRPRKWRITGRQ